MSDFLGPNYLLGNQPGRTLYSKVRDLPILDAHNHADVAAIAANEPYRDLWEIEAAADHYVWELLRKRGVAEALVTGSASNHRKWLAAAAVFEELAGNPTYDWVHLDLERVLGIDTPVNADSAEDIWKAARAILKRDDMRPQQLIRRMNVEAMCSTDDPADTLEHHRALAASPLAGVVRPTFRPDAAMNIRKPTWRAYVERLEAACGGAFAGAGDLRAGLAERHDVFAANGCLASDHGVTVPYAWDVDFAEADAIFRKARAGADVTADEEATWMSWFLQEMAALDSDKGWVFQLHIGAVRDVRASLFTNLGPDTGGDVSSHMIPVVEPLKGLLNRFDGKLKIILYCLDPGMQPTLATLTRAFGADVNLGSAWWLNDSPVGMRQQLEYVAQVDLLANHAGMVSDSRKLLSYASRHEMFRRVLCDVVGGMVQQGRMPMRVAAKLVAKVAYDNPKQIFGF